MSYKPFFIEINIPKLSCKSTRPFLFVQVFKRNEAGSKIFYNKPVYNFYVDKMAVMDLI